MGQFLQMGEVKEPTGAFDRVDGAKNPRKQLWVVRVFLQRDQIDVELIEILVALLQKGGNEFVVHVHRGASAAPTPPPTENRCTACRRSAESRASSSAACWVEAAPRLVP